MAEEKKQEQKAQEPSQEQKNKQPTPPKGATTEKAQKVEVPQKFQSLVEQIEKMNVMDLAELVKVFEKKFGVSAQTPVVAAMPQPGHEEAKQEKTTFTVELTKVGANKIASIKAVREVTTLGLKEAKDLVEKAPAVVAENIKKEEAEKIKGKLEAAGATVTLK